ncbi:MAG: DEAD/DEAH box helicase, partial [Mobilicoccus sp.]|nr:DEAD/DEAH box helicase [Mobilicoccus sp.]
MTTSIDPLSTAARVSTSYERYLGSILPVQEPRMRAALTAAIGSYGAVTKGPYLEASPPYEAGATIRDLVNEGVLCEETLGLTSAALPADRPLYRHQEQAIRKAASGRSLVVATGTGSGKTESFLVPILDRLCREKTDGTLGPGVRALLLYPMNALANDQVKRLRSLLAHYPDITFGRYTGETKELDDQALDLYRNVQDGQNPLPNELISRRQMRETPPHILLTNFAMLEYLLLRPLDLDLFEGDYAGHWRWLAVDEAHVYSGAQGSEVAMLLRRLRHRVARDDTQFQTIATSATVGDDLAAVADFASGLTASDVEYVAGEPERQDVIPATRRELPSAGDWSLSDPSEFERLAATDDPDREIR